MTRRERVCAALNHRQPDRVAVDFGAHRSSGIMAIAYRKLREHLGLPVRPIRVYDMVQQLAVLDEDVLDRFGVDCIELGRGFDSLTDWKPWTLPDGTDCRIPSWIDVRRDGGDWLLYNARGTAVAVQKAGSLYFEQLCWPYLDGLPADLSSLPQAMDDILWCVPAPPGPGADVVAGARAFRAGTDRAIVGLFGGNLLEWMQFLLRNDNCFMLLAGEPQEAHRLLDALVEIHLRNLDRYMGNLRDCIDVIAFGDDLGMQTGPQISPAMYREFFQPRHAVLWKRAKELAPKVKVMLHSCGGIYPLLEDLVAAGLDAVNPVQISCSRMEASTLKREFGSRLCFWGGGCDTRQVLPQGTPAQIRQHVLEQLRTWSPGGGFVFQQVHNIMSDVPPENVVAMFDAVAEFSSTRVGER